LFIDINYSKELKKAKLHLSKPSKQIISHISERRDGELSAKLGNINELNFSIPYTVEENGKLVHNKHVDMIKEKMLIKMSFNNTYEWFIVESIKENGDDETLFNVQCFSLGFELTHKRVLQLNYESVNATSLLNDLLSVSTWKIKEVDPKFDAMFRSFDFSNTNRLDCIIQASETFGALIEWDTINKKISFVKFEADEGEISTRGQFKGLTANYGKLLRSVEKDRVSNELTTRLYVYGSEELGIHSVNPTGQGYLEDFSFFMYPFERNESKQTIKSSHYMSDELCHAILDFQELLLSVSESIRSNMDSQVLKSAEVANEKQVLTTLELEMDTILNKLDVAKSTEDESLITQLEGDRSAKQAQIDSQRAVVTLKTSELNSIKMALENIHQQLNEDSNFTQELQDELNFYVLEKEWRDDRYIDVKELYDDGVKKFKELREPNVVLSIDMENFLNILEEQFYWDKLVLGDLIKIKYTEMNLEYMAKIIEIKYNFDDNSISLTIANTTKIGSDIERLRDLLYKTENASTLIQNNKHKWDKVGFVEDEVYKLINDTHDANKREITAGVDNEITIGKRGIIARSPSNPNDVVIIQSGIIALSKTNGDKWETALTADGVIADRLVGNVLIGRNLIMTNSSGHFYFDDTGMRVKTNQFILESETETETFDVIKSKIDMSAGKIALIVGSDNKLNGEAIASSIVVSPNAIDLMSQNINFTSRGLDLASSIKISPQAIDLISESINLTGKVTFSSFDPSTKNSLETVTGWKATNKTTIDGGKIETNTIGANQIKTNELIVGVNIAMGANAVIDWNQVGSKPFIPSNASDIGALSSSSPMLTYITGTGIYTGTLSADKIIGGTITGITINVTTDLDVGNNIYLGRNTNATKMIKFNSSATIYSENSSSLSVSALTFSVRDGDVRLGSNGYSVALYGTVDLSTASSVSWGSHAPVAKWG